MVPGITVSSAAERISDKEEYVILHCYWEGLYSSIEGE